MNAGTQSPKKSEVAGITAALRRAGKRVLEIGFKTGTSVWVVENGKLVDLTRSKRINGHRAARTGKAP